jgi:hypothetical protein
VFPPIDLLRSQPTSLYILDASDPAGWRICQLSVWILHLSLRKRITQHLRLPTEPGTTQNPVESACRIAMHNLYYFSSEYVLLNAGKCLLGLWSFVASYNFPGAVASRKCMIASYRIYYLLGNGALALAAINFKLVGILCLLQFPAFADRNRVLSAGKKTCKVVHHVSRESGSRVAGSKLRSL